MESWERADPVPLTPPCKKPTVFTNSVTLLHWET